MENTTWLQHVEEGKAIVAKLSESEIRTAEWRLALGEKIEEVYPKGDSQGARSDLQLAATAASSLEQYADAIGVARNTTREYRDVAVAVRNVDTTGMSWAAIRQLASVKGDKQVVLDEIKTAKPSKEPISRNDILEHQGKPKADGVKNTPNVNLTQDVYTDDGDDDSYPVINGGCPVLELTLEEFERGILPSVEFWPWFTKGFRPSVVKQLITSDKREEDCCLTKEHILDALITIQQTLTNYIKEIRKEL